MDREGFRRFLIARKLAEHEINQQIDLVEQFVTFLEHRPDRQVALPASSADTRQFIALLVEEKSDTYENILALLRYGRYSRNNAIILPALELLDGGEVMNNLYARVGEAVGETVRDEIFAGIELPTWGTPNSLKPSLMRVVVERMERLIDPVRLTQLLSGCLRDLADEYFIEDRRQYIECGDIDAYLDFKRREHLSELEKIRSAGDLYFNQEITAEVLDYVRANQEVAVGERQGTILYVTKIPYMAKEYLAESDPRKKRYYACHCPWVREAIMGKGAQVPAIFCQCSAGFHKKSWEVIFDQQLQVEVLESVLNGDLRCRFAIHLPPERLGLAR